MGFTAVGHLSRLTSCPSSTRKSVDLTFMFVLSSQRERDGVAYSIRPIAGDNDLCAFPCEQTRFCLAHPMGTTSNDANFVFEPHCPLSGRGHEHDGPISSVERSSATGSCSHREPATTERAQGKGHDDAHGERQNAGGGTARTTRARTPRAAR